MPLGWFYFPTPALLVALLAHVVGYSVAFKLIAVLGLLLMPLGAAVRVWGWGGDRVESATAAVAMVVLVVATPSIALIGGDIHSAVLGEFSYQLALALGMCALGALGRVAQGKARGPLAAVVIAATLTAHVVASLLVVVGSVAVVAIWWQRSGIRAAATAVVGAAIAGVWMIPVLVRSGWATDIDPERWTSTWSALFPATYRWLTLFAGAALAFAVVRRSRVTIGIAGVAVVFGLAYLWFPAGHHLWNARLLGVWYACIAMLAALGVVASARAARPLLPPIGGLAPALTLLAAAGVAIWTIDAGVIPRTEARSSLAGFEARATWPELDRLLDTVAALPSGRLAAEYTEALTTYGSWRALDLIPVRTDGRVQVLDTLYAESSTTTPFIYSNMSLLSAEPSRRIPGLELGTPADFDRGVDQLELLGIRYFLASSDAITAKADDAAALRKVADLPALTDAGIHWRLYELTDHAVVEGLDALPAITDSWAGVESLETLVRGYIPHGQLGVTKAGEIRSAGGIVVRNPLDGNPYHCLVSCISPVTLSNLLRPTIKNPYQ